MNKTQPQHQLTRNLVTAAGIVRCRFDMMIRFPESKPRLFTSNPFTERGDRFADNKNDVRKMLRYLVRYFAAKHQKEKWVRCELYDNSKPLEDPERVILKYEHGEIISNLLINEYYAGMLQQVNYALPPVIFSAVPEHLK